MLSRDCDGCSHLTECRNRYRKVSKGEKVYCPDGTAHGWTNLAYAKAPICTVFIWKPSNKPANFSPAMGPQAKTEQEGNIGATGFSNLKDYLVFLYCLQIELEASVSQINSIPALHCLHCIAAPLIPS